MKTPKRSRSTRLTANSNQQASSSSMANRQRTKQHLGISDLPRNIVDTIFECLPLTDAMNMSVVSKKWRNFWLTLPNISLDDHSWEIVLPLEDNYLIFRDIVSGVLLSHIGPVTKFYLCIPEYVSDIPCISQWISFLSINGIRYLTIENWCGTAELPSALFYCLDLVKLNLTSFKFSPPPSFRGFPKLEYLMLQGITFTTGRLGGFISNCPRLEEVKLVKWIGLGTISINAPKLKSLLIFGSSLRFISLRNVADLISVSITFNESAGDSHKGITRDMLKTLAESCKLEKLCFGNLFWKFLGASSISEMLPITFHYLRDLQLSTIDLNDHGEVSCALGIIRSCPNLVELHISVDTKTRDVLKDLDFYNHGLVLNHLRNASIRHIRGFSRELKLIEYVFASSPVLEEFSVEYDGGLKATVIIEMSKELMRFSRASPRAKLIFEDPQVM